MARNYKNVMTFRNAESLLQGNGSRSVPGRGHTFLRRIDHDTIAIVLYSTEIVTLHRDGTYTLNNGGYQTSTTKRRINEFAPVNIWSSKGTWYISDPVDDETDVPVKFFDGIRVDANGVPLNPKVVN